MNVSTIFEGNQGETLEQVIDRFAETFWDKPRKWRWDVDRKAFRMINGNKQYNAKIECKAWCIFEVVPKSA